MNSSERNLLITGASGMIGSALKQKLSAKGYKVYALSRSNNQAPFYYDQQNNVMHLSREIPLHGVINLAGANISDKRWSTKRKQEIIDSRRLTTEALCKALSELPGKPDFLLSASAIGYYGDTGDEIVDEMSPAADDFLAQLSVTWEQATEAVSAAGIRTVQMRFGLVLSPAGGVLKNFILPLKLMSVGQIGNGKHYMSWISIDDALLIIERLIEDESFSGPINLVADLPVTNAEFMTTLARTLHCLKMPPLPAFVVRLMFGEMADAALLLSSQVRSKRLQELGIQLQHPTLGLALQSLLKP